MFVTHFGDPDLRVEIFFKKEEAAENGDIDFDKGNISTTVCTAFLLFFFWWQKIDFKSSIDMN